MTDADDLTTPSPTTPLPGPPGGPSLVTRRRALGLLGVFSVVGLAACADGGAGNASRARSTTSTSPVTTTTPASSTPATTLPAASTVDGVATFTSIFPACYSGRWPHIHFEVYRDVATAIAAGAKLATSQIALLADTCNVVYTTDGYAQSVSNLAQISLTTDNVFSDDGGVHELPTVSGSVADDYVVSLTAGVSSSV